MAGRVKDAMVWVLGVSRVFSLATEQKQPLGGLGSGKAKPEFHGPAWPPAAGQRDAVVTPLAKECLLWQLGSGLGGQKSGY